MLPGANSGMKRIKCAMGSAWVGGGGGLWEGGGVSLQLILITKPQAARQTRDVGGGKGKGGEGLTWDR
jgi:hypothetical protein